MPARLTIDSLRELAVSQGGLLLSTTYSGSKEPLLWRCKNGHEWSTSAGCVKHQGSWCRRCDNDTKRLSLDDLQDLAIKRGGLLLSIGYENANINLRWRCKIGHEWLASAHNIKRWWCKKCAHQSKMTEMSTLQSIANERGGLLVSNRYSGANNLLEWSCRVGHHWKATASNVMNGSSWCGACVVDAKRLDISELQDIASSYGGNLLSTNYKDSKTLLSWICAKGHEWKASANNVRQRHSWCPTCASGKGERMARRCFEHIFKHPFPSSRRQWLGRQHLDGFCEELALAFEYDGNQHFEIVAKFGMSQSHLDANVARDKRKDDRCSKNGVNLIRLREVSPLNELAMIQAVVKAIRSDEYAMSLCENLGLKLPRKVSPELRAAMYDTGCDGTGQLFIPGLLNQSESAA